MILSSTSVEARERRSARTRFGIAALLIALAVTGTGEAARADVSPSARALARSLFEDARALMGDKKYAEACPKLAESMRLDPAAGTQLNLAFCHDGEGRTATAWAEYNDALTQARRDGRPEREEFVSAKLRALSPRLTFLAVTLAPGADVPGLEVSLDGAVVGAAALGAASAVDPGTHTLAARAPKFSTWSVEVKVAAGDPKRTVSVPHLEKAAIPEASASSPSGVDAATHPDGARSADGDARRSWGFALLGTGLAAVGVGGAFGVDAVVKWRDRNAACVHGCTETGVQAGTSAQTSAWVADFTVGAGIAALAAGAYLLLTPTPRRAQTGKASSLRVLPILTETEVGIGLGGVME